MKKEGKQCSNIIVVTYIKDQELSWRVDQPPTFDAVSDSFEEILCSEIGLVDDIERNNINYETQVTTE
jgi:hypothetical protein